MPDLDKYQTDEIEIDILDVLRDILKDWWLILLIGVTAAMCAYIVANITYKPTYTTSATFVVTSKGSNNTYANLSATNTVATSLTKIFDSNLLKKKVTMDIGSDKVPGTIMAEVIPETNLFVLRVSAPTSAMAFKTITSIMKNYTSVTNHVFGNAILDVLEAPRVPLYPNNYLDIRGIMKMAFWIGAGAMAVLLAALSVLRDNVKNEKEIARKLDTKLFGVIYHEKKYKTLGSRFKKSKKSILITSPTVSFSFVENYKKMRAKLEFKAFQNFHKVILITSALENEGKSTVAVNLALSLAQKSQNVLLLDGDLCNPSVYKVMQRDVQKEQELGENIQKDSDLKGTLSFDENSGLYLVAGSRHYENSADLLVKESFREFIKVSKKIMDFIIIDAPPLLAVADTEILADIADASLLVVRQSHAKTKEVNDAIDILNNSNSKLLGCVFNNVKTTLFGYRAGYGKNYAYQGYYGNTENKQQTAVNRIGGSYE